MRCDSKLPFMRISLRIARHTTTLPTCLPVGPSACLSVTHPCARRPRASPPRWRPTRGARPAAPRSPSCPSQSRTASPAARGRPRGTPAGRVVGHVPIYAQARLCTCMCGHVVPISAADCFASSSRSTSQKACSRGEGLAGPLVRAVHVVACLCGVCAVPVCAVSVRCLCGACLCGCAVRGCVTCGGRAHLSRSAKSSRSTSRNACGVVGHVPCMPWPACRTVCACARMCGRVAQSDPIRMSRAARGGNRTERAEKTKKRTPPPPPVRFSGRPARPPVLPLCAVYTARDG
jgi:hypothetical protein